MTSLRQLFNGYGESMPLKSNKQIILASASQTRKEMLSRVEIDFEIFPSSVDEEQIKLDADFTKLSELALKLARAKAEDVSQLNPEAYVIAADQLCVFEGQVLNKPGTRERCIEHLKLLKANTHEQNCAVALYHDGELLWQQLSTAYVTLRDLTDIEIEAYVDLEQPYQSCGSYMLEKHGKHIFKKVEGDHDVVLGLPLIDLLNKFY